jgi:hypothetical protein
MAIPTPVINWRFNDSAANYGSGGSTYNLTLSGAAYSPNRIEGSKSMYVDGSNDYAYVNASPFTSTGTSITTAFWAYPTGYGWAGMCVNFGGNSSTSQHAVRMGIDNNGAINLSVPGYCNFTYSGFVATTNAWNFYVIVYKGTWDVSTPANTTHAWVNKTKSSTTVVSGTTNPNPIGNSICIGRQYIDWSSPYWYYSGSGYMDEVYIFNSALSDDNVRELYDFTAPKFDMNGYA